MGYDIHITRKENWFDEHGKEISLGEWLAHVSGDPELRLDGYAEAHMPSGTIFRSVNPSMATWIAHPEHGKRYGQAWIWLSEGNIQAKNPDDDTLRKMWRIAQAFDARVQGDNCELYDSNGSMFRVD